MIAAILLSIFLTYDDVKNDIVLARYDTRFGENIARIERYRTGGKYKIVRCGCGKEATKLYRGQWICND